jgi:hypothetical protein
MCVLEHQPSRCVQSLEKKSILQIPSHGHPVAWSCGCNFHDKYLSDRKVCNISSFSTVACWNSSKHARAALGRSFGALGPPILLSTWTLAAAADGFCYALVV